MDQLKLVALDKEDIEVVSAHLQDSVVKAADIRWRPAEKRLIIALNRFDWESANNSPPQYRRRQSVVRFDRVTACKCRNCAATEKDHVLHLLAVTYDELGETGGVVTLTFSGGAALRLEVECLEVELADLGPAWTAEIRPFHPLDAEITQNFKQG
jgi:hypothetical protein